ncbi:hypothetical protein AYI68_g1854 [Smittium mucronatum]|uniref:Uncharacterized protein n=1 Tax=Smittium mucronatum TaxID=133383 RepID=A0A1R0H4I0_9FUNG|nr:hypothetical protein AYI68_g1854 [Smittium mucronatum]
MSGLGASMIYRVGSVYGLFSSLKEFSSNKEYVNIRQAMKDIQREVMNARGIDNSPSVLPTRKPNFSKLPPSTPASDSGFSNSGEQADPLVDPWGSQNDYSSQNSSWDRPDFDSQNSNKSEYEDQNGDYVYNEKKWN